MAEEINWDEATKSGNFVELKEDVEKVLVVTNFKLEKKATDAKVAAGKIEFVADVLEEDGKAVPEKDEIKFTTTSVRLKKKLRPIFEDKKTSEKVTLKILRIGDKFDTQYSVKEIKGEKEKKE